MVVGVVKQRNYNIGMRGCGQHIDEYFDRRWVVFRNILDGMEKA